MLSKARLKLPSALWRLKRKSLNFRVGRYLLYGGIIHIFSFYMQKRGNIKPLGEEARKAENYDVLPFMKCHREFTTDTNFLRYKSFGRVSYKQHVLFLIFIKT